MKTDRNSCLAAWLLASTFLLGFPTALSAQDVAAWFSKAANKGAYNFIATDVDALAARLRSANLSDSLISARLEEGLRKGVSASDMLSTLKIDVERYIQVSKTLEFRHLLAPDGRKSSETVSQIALLLRAGTTQAELEASLDAGVSALGAKASAVARAIAALTVTASARAELNLREEDSPAFVIALIRSGLDDIKPGSIIASAKKLVAKGESATMALNKVLASLSANDSAKSNPENPKGKDLPASNENKDKDRKENNQGNGKKLNGNGIDGEKGIGKEIAGSKN